MELKNNFSQELLITLKFHFLIKITIQPPLVDDSTFSDVLGNSSSLQQLFENITIDRESERIKIKSLIQLNEKKLFIPDEKKPFIPDEMNPIL